MKSSKNTVQRIWHSFNISNPLNTAIKTKLFHQKWCVFTDLLGRRERVKIKLLMNFPKSYEIARLLVISLGTTCENVETIDMCWLIHGKIARAGLAGVQIRADVQEYIKQHAHTYTYMQLYAV